MENRIPNWQKTFFTIWSGQVFSLLSSAIVQFAIIWWLTIETGSATVLSIASLFGLLPQALCGPFVGALVDRWNRKVVMIVADLAIAAASLGLALLFFYGEPAVWHIYAILSVRSLGAAFHWPAMQASIPLIVPAEQLTRVAGFSQGIQSAANIAGPALGALVVALWPMAGVMLLDVAGAVIASLALLLVLIPQPPAVETEVHGHGLMQEMYFGFKVLAQARGLFMLTLVSAISVFIYVPVGSLFPLMVTGHFSGGVWHVGAVEIAFGSGMLLGSLVLGLWGGTRKRVYTINVSTAAMGLALIIMGGLPAGGFVWFAGATVFLGLTVPMFTGPFTALLQTKIEPGVQGRVFSFVSSIIGVATPLGLLVAGPAADKWGIPLLFLGSGILITLIGVGSFLVPSIMQLEEG